MTNRVAYCHSGWLESLLGFQSSVRSIGTSFSFIRTSRLLENVLHSQKIVKEWQQCSQLQHDTPVLIYVHIKRHAKNFIFSPSNIVSTSSI